MTINDGQTNTQKGLAFRQDVDLVLVKLGATTKRLNEVPEAAKESATNEPR